MKKILITGGGGYIGSVSSDLFLKNGYEIVVADNFSTGFRQPLEILKKKYGQDKFRYYELDLNKNIADIFQKEKNIEAVIHYAASCVVDESMKNPYKYFHNNAGGSLNLLQAMTDNGVNKIVLSSTCAVYGEVKQVPIDENCPTNPNNTYGEAKHMMERIIHWYGKIKGMKYILLRYFNVSGASEDGVFGYSKNPSTHLMENAVKGALGIMPFFLTYQEADTQDGSPIRDFCNIVDLNEAHLKAAAYLLDGGSSEIINLGTGTGNSVLEIVNKVQENTGVKFDIKKGQGRQGEASKLIASIAKAKLILGWEPKRSVEDSVKSLVTWFKTRPKGWDY